MRENLPRLLFVLVPAFAVLLRLVYRNRGRTLPAHLVFALHVHAFVFTALLFIELVLVVASVQAKYVQIRTAAAVWLWILVYLALALHRVYGGRWSATILRASALVILYAGVAAAALGALVVGTYFAMGAPA